MSLSQHCHSVRPVRASNPGSRRRLVLSAVVVALLSAAGNIWSQTPQEQPGSKGWIALFLLPKVGEALVGSTTLAASCVFLRLFTFLGAGNNPNNPNCNTGGQGNLVPQNAGFNAYGQPIYLQPGQGGQAYGNAPMPPPGSSYAGQAAGGYPVAPAYPSQNPGGYPTAPPPPGQVNAAPAAPAAPAAQAAQAGLNPGQAAALSTQPILSFVVQKLSSAVPHSPVHAVLVEDRFSQQTEPSFSLATGEAFAIKFSTSVPGRVRLINTDVDAVVSTSPLYEAVPGNDNRMPREYEGGIEMTGKPGIEYLEVEFVPCVSQALVGHPSVQPFNGQLPACTLEPATKQYRPALANGRGGLVAMGGKAMVFPASGDPSQPVAIAPGNYAKGEMLRFRLRIQHLPKS